jgi:Clp amino terminal domain, pathogenicity island component
MFERFTEAARQAIVLAQEEARILKHNYIGTEHLLLGVARIKHGPTVEALARCGLGHDQIRDRVVRIIGAGTEAARGQIPFTPRATKALEVAARESEARGQHTGPEHLLLGLLSDEESVACRVIRESGVKPARIRNEIAAELVQMGPSDAQPVEVRSTRLGRSVADGYSTSAEPIGADDDLFLHQLCQTVELIALACTGLVVTGALVAVAVLDAESRSPTAVEAGVLAGAAFGPASMLVVVADAANRVRRVLGAGADALPVAVMTIAAVGLGAAGIAVHAVTLTITLGAAASAVAVVAAGYALKTPSRSGR